MHTGAEWTSKKYGAATATGRIAANWGGGLKLYGGFLGAIGSVIGGVIDVQGGLAQYDKNRKLLAGAYFIRSMASFAVVSLTLGVAISGSGPYLRLLMSRTQSALFLSALRALELLATRMAAEQVLKMMRAGLARLAWVGLAVSGIVWFLDPKVIESWSEKSVFRKNKKSKGFKQQGDELFELETAFNKMVEN